MTAVKHEQEYMEEIVMFSIEAGGAREKKEDKEDAEKHKNKLEDMIQDLSLAMTAVKHEQEYMEVRERIHRSINDNTNTRVVMWAIFECFVLVMMTAGQIYYLKLLRGE